MTPKPPLAITLDAGTEKVSGFIMKLTHSGLLVELEKIPFKVGSYVTVIFSLDEKNQISERARSIKHYDKFFRTQPKKSKESKEAKEASEVKLQPKKLCELHFQSMTETGKMLISNHIIKHNVAQGNK